MLYFRVKLVTVLRKTNVYFNRIIRYYCYICTVNTIQPKTKNKTMKKAVIYSRVSTDRQSTDRQIQDLQGWAVRNNYNVINTFEDVISGKTSAQKRKGANALFKYIKSNKIDIVLTTEISRIGRSAFDAQKNIDTIVNKLGINLYIHQQNMLAYDSDGKKNMTFKLITDVLANVAQMEREQLSQRIKSGLAAARKQGRIGGRKKGAKKSNAAIIKEYSKVVSYVKKGNMSLREISKLTSKSVNTIRKVKAALVQMSTQVTNSTSYNSLLEHGVLLATIKHPDIFADWTFECWKRGKNYYIVRYSTKDENHAIRSFSKKQMDVIRSKYELDETNETFAQCADLFFSAQK